MPFKSVQSPSMEAQQQQQQKLGSGSSSSEETKKKQTGLSAIVSATAPLRPSAQQHPQQQQPGSVMNGSGSIFSFNSTHSVRGAADCSSAAETYDYDSNFDKDSSASFDFNRGGGGAVGGAYGPRAAAAGAAVGPLLKPTPSKWDDAEKWLSASCDQAPGLSNAKAAATAAAGGTTITTTIKSKSGPWQSAHVVAANQQQGGGGVTSKKVTFSNLDDPESSSSPNRRLKEEDDDELQGGIHVPAVDLSLAAAAGAAVGSSSPGTNNTRGSVSTRDMGTEMTPIASVEPSRTATPLRATTPNLGSPINSRPSTPDRASISTSSSSNKLPLSGKELQAKTRQEILALGTQLGKPNIAAWATKEEEEADAAKALKASVELEEVRKNLLASRAAAWEEAEQAKYAARFKREEAKIQAWENHEKAKAEAEMRRIEVKVERMWSHANESMMNKLAAAHRRAEDLRAAAEARRSEQIAKAAVHAEHIRATGKMPTTTFFFARLCQ
ncbi:unnamed protein product [Sphagnum troendelagicum]|uniref:Remorin C-terminal domain-containing protein n=1 Tax=Sphagnum troendelagicum TaxID=128251 RepID=A0ABP0TX94_9BRYO